MEKIKREIFAEYQPVIRENEDGSSSRTIEGYGIVFGQKSRPLFEWGKLFREVIEPTAITQEEISEHDIKMTMYHNRERILARRNKGAGSLSLEVDENGVKYTFEAPHTPDGDTALELVRRGDIAGASFMFWSDEDASMRYEREKDGSIVRYVTHLDSIFDVTLAADPAYPQTTAGAREMPLSLREMLEDKEEEKPEEAVEEEHREEPQDDTAAIEAVRKFLEIDNYEF